MLRRKFHIIIAVFIFTALFSTAGHAQLPQVSSGLSYLASAQNPDGTWGTDTSQVETTAVTVSVLDTLKLLNQTAGTSYVAGASWLQSQSPLSVDYIADRIRTLSLTDNSINALLPLIDPSKGAWGGDEGYTTNILDTALVLQALKATNYADLFVINAALAYLTASQKADGGWGSYSGDVSNVYMTAIVSATLQQFPQTASTATAINKAAAYLISRQNTDGGFGSPPSTVYETALAYAALVAVTTDATVLGNAINYLTTTQAADGSWNQDPYSTALALKALYLSENRPALPTTAPTTATVNGTVLDASTNQPLSGVAVTLAGNPALSALTNGAGSFTLADVPQGTQHLTFTLAGYAAATTTLQATAGSIINLGSIPLAVVPDTGIIQGTITDAASGGPLAGVAITVTGTATWTATTAADGTFRITGITPGEVAISASKPGYTQVAGTGTVVAGGTLIFSPALGIAPPPAQTGTLQGKVVDAATGAPLTGANIFAAGTKNFATTTDTAGDFTIAAIDAGDYTITVAFPGYGTQTYGVTIAAGTTTNVGSVTLKQNALTGTVQGVVTDESTGAPLAGVAITVSGSGTWSAVTGADGTYRLPGIDPGTVTLTANKSGYITATGTGTVAAGGTLVFSVALTPYPPATSDLKGIVIDSSTGVPVSGAVVSMTTGTAPAVTATTDASGTFIFKSLASGTYSITVTATGYTSRSGTLTVISGVTNDVGTIEIIPAPTVTTITGRITDEASGKPLASVDVSVAGTTLAARTGSDGVYSLTGVTSATFTVKATAPGYDSSSYVVTSTVYGIFTVDFALTQSDAGDIAITSVTTDNTVYPAHAGVTVTATVTNTGASETDVLVIANVKDSLGNIVAIVTPDTPEITIPPSSSTTTSLVWDTEEFAPGDYQILVKAADPDVYGEGHLPGVVKLAERSAPITIQPTVGIANSAVKCDPPFVYTGYAAPLDIGLTVTNRSNIAANLTINYDMKSPSGVVLTSGSTSAALSLDTISTTIPLTLLNHTFTESGEYPIHAVVYNDGAILGEIRAAFVVLSNIRIEATRTVTPNVLLPNGTGKVTTTIQLSGKGENNTIPNPAPTTIKAPLGYKAELFASGLYSPVAVRVNGNDELLVAESSKDRIVKVAPNGSVSIFAKSDWGTPLDFAPGVPARIDFDKNGNLYVACVGWYDNPYNPYGDVLDTIYKITPAGEISAIARQYVPPNIFYDIVGLAVSPDGALFVGETHTPHDILKIDLATKTSTQFATSVYYPSDLLFDKAGNLYATMRSSEAEKFKVYRFAPDGTRTVYNDTISGPGAMAWGPDGKLFVRGGTAVYTIDPVTKAVAVFATGFTNPYDLDFDSKGNLYVLEYGGQIIKISKTAAVFTDVRLIDTIPANNAEFVLSSVTKSPFSVTTTGDGTVVEWRYGSVTAGQDQTISYDLNLANLIPGEDRTVSRTLSLAYTDLNNKRITVTLPPLSVHVSTSAFAVALTADKTAYMADENGVLGATIKNLSDFSRTIDISVMIEDDRGNPVQTVSTLPGVPFAAGETKTLSNIIFATGSYYAGDYRAHLILSENQSRVGEAFSSFTIQPTAVPNSTSALTATVSTDRLSYDPNEIATLTSVVTSQSVNFIQENLTATVMVGSRQSALYTGTKTISTLMPGASFTFNSYWNTGTAPPGTYPVTLTVKDVTGAIVATATQSLVIADTQKPTKLLKGEISLDKQNILTGEPVTVSYSVTNTGNIALSNIILSVQTINLNDQTVCNTITDQASLAMGSTFTNSGRIDTQGYSARDYLVVLRASIAGAEETLAGTYFRVEGAPSAPALAGPADGADVATLTPTLLVSNAADPNDDRLTYEFEVYADSGLTNLVTSGTVSETAGITAWTVSAPLTENQTCYWRARANDGQLYGPWMAAASFRVNTANDPPSAPTVAGPADGTAVAILTPTLAINNASDPDSASLTYNFEIALDPGFTQLVASARGVTGGQGTTSWTVPVSLQENGWYYWRAQADDLLVEGPWSTTARFLVNTANDAPSAPAVTAPANGSTTTALATDVVVANSTDPDSPILSYNFEADTVPTFDSANIIRSGSVAEGQETTVWHLSGLQDNTRYYLRVKASDGTTESPWSAVTAFVANTANDPPTIPILANPSNGAGVNVFTPTLSVHNATDLDMDVLTYEFEVYADAAMTNLVAQATGITETAQVTSWMVPVSLTENQTCWWRARAFDGALHGGWTPAAAFMVNTANDAPGAPRLSAPAEGESVATLTPTLAVVNAVDPDSDNLTYEFEIYSGASLVAATSGVPQDDSGVTAWTPASALADNTVYQWRARAYDGDRNGPWTAMATFTVHLPKSSINATVDFDPDTLNKSSNGSWVVVYIELPAGYKPADIDISSIRFEGTIQAETWPCAIGDHDKDGVPDLMVKFKRSDVINLLNDGENVPVHVTGKVGSTPFEGVDMIRVIQH